MSSKNLKFKIVSSLLALSMTVVSALGSIQAVGAVPVVGFNAGRIIDDGVMMNGTSMDPNQIQAFLSSKVPSCDTGGSQQSEMNNSGVPDYNNNGSIQRWEWAKYKYNQTSFPCLRDYVEGGHSAAQIIYGAAQQYSINPQVLIALLQKEQGLVTDTWPLATQYKSATGYGCPDTAPCDAQYYGLTNQLNQSANMFRQIMVASPSWYTPYVVGNNTIRWNPAASCGSSTVNIENRSTQALYNYTPYRPNQAALNAGYGTGDSCSAYGNRNFYLYFTDWFGPTTANSTLVRTPENGTVYLIANYTRYSIASMDTLGSLNLGGIGYVSQGYLDSLANGSTLGRLIKGNDGTVYYFDAKIKLPFSSCALVADYGYTCGQAVLLPDWQIQSFASGPSMTNFYKTTSGKSFYIKSGQKREVFDDQALSAAGLSGAYNTISESPLSNLTYGLPIVRNNVVVNDRANGSSYLIDQGQLIATTAQTRDQTYIGQLPSEQFDTASISQLTLGSGLVNGLVQDATTGDHFVLAGDGKIKLTDTSPWPGSFTPISSSLAGAIPTTATRSPSYLIKSPSSSTVYYLDAQKKRPLSAWSDVQKINPASTIITVPDYTINGIPDGTVVLNQGGLVKSVSNSTVYYVDGLSNLIPITSFGIVQEAGVPLNTATVSDAVVSAYTHSSTPINTLLQCGGSKYIAAIGRLNKVSSSLDATTGLTYQTLAICPSSAVTDLGGNFFLDQTGTIYQIASGKKNPIGSWSKYLSLGGGVSNTVGVSNYVTNDIPTGTLLN